MRRKPPVNTSEKSEITKEVLEVFSDEGLNVNRRTSYVVHPTEMKAPPTDLEQTNENL